MEVGGKTYTLLPNMVKIKRGQKKVHGKCVYSLKAFNTFPDSLCAVVDVVPSVIEPSFGIGRILYAVLEHAFRVRKGDEKRVWLSIPPAVAPISCSVLLLSANEQFQPFVPKIGKIATTPPQPELQHLP